MARRTGTLIESYKERLSYLQLTTPKNGVRVRTLHQFKMDNFDCELCIEYDPKYPQMGIYYGCKCTNATKQGCNQLDEKFDPIVTSICEVLNLTLFTTIDFRPCDNQYWPFWIKLEEGEPADTPIANIERIKDVMERMYNVIF